MGDATTGWDANSTLNALQKSFVTANRNKPLPVPDASESSLITSADASITTMPIATLDAAAESDAASPPPGLKYVLDRSSKLLRPNGLKHECDDNVRDRRSALSTSAKTMRSQLSSTSSSAQDSKDATEKRPNPSPSSSLQTQGSASTFGFMRRSSSRTSCSLSPQPQESKSRPALRRSGLSSSSSSRSSTSLIGSGGLSGERRTSQQGSTRPASLRLSQQPQPSAGKSIAQVENDDREGLVIDAIARASQKHKSERPPLIRLRSRSVDELAPTKQSSPSIAKVSSRPLSHISPTDRASTGNMQVAAKARAEIGAGGSPSRPSSRYSLREGTLSRLAGSLRRGVTPGATSTNEQETAVKPELRSRSAFNLRHLRRQSVQVAGGKVTGDSKTTGQGSRSVVPVAPADPPKVPPKEPVRLRGDAWWDEAQAREAVQRSVSREPKVEGTEEESSHDSLLGELQAAQLAAAINAGDETVVHRMAAAIESPKQALKPFPPQEDFEQARMPQHPSVSSSPVQIEEDALAKEVRDDVKKYEAFVTSTFESVAVLRDATDRHDPLPFRSLRLASPPTAYNAARLSQLTRSESMASAIKTGPAESVGVRARKLSSPMTSARASEPAMRRALTLDVGMAKVDAPRRSSTSLGMASTVFRAGVRRGSADRGPTLDIADDMEFLRALEDVRRSNQERIRSGGRQRTWSRMSGGSSREDVNRSNSPPPGGRLNALPMDSPLSEHSTCTNSSVDTPEGYCGNSTGGGNAVKPSPLELGVGKASGKLRDGAFLNDEDWKKEVKALFVIRELVLTERSYARHLQSLLLALNNLTASPAALSPPRRSSTTPSLMMTSSSTLNMARNHAEQPPPPHIAFLRKLLPQLITLSSTLANQIDLNPTAAGVGAAFRLVSAQMEACFVSWSSGMKDVMDALRAGESGKARSRYRIGLIVVAPPVTMLDRESAVEIGRRSAVAASVPSSPVRSKTMILRETRTEVLPPVFSESPIALSFGVDDAEEVPIERQRKTAAKRRSTISAVSPSAATHWQAKISSSLAKSTASEDGGHALSARRGSNGSTTLSRSLTKTLTATSDAWNERRMSGKAHSGTCTPSSSSADHHGNTIHSVGSLVTQKRFTAMDIAIMPVQRIPRYLLLLRDLHLNTPPSSLSHARIQRSLDFLHRVATDCDRASKITFSWSKPTVRMR